MRYFKRDKNIRLIDKIAKNVYFIEIYTSRIKDFYPVDLNHKICIGLLDDIANNNKALTRPRTCNIILFPCFPTKQRLEAPASVHLFLQLNDYLNRKRV